MEEIEKEVKQGQGIDAHEKSKGKEKDTINEFDVFTVDYIIDNIVLDIPNLTKDVDQPVEYKSITETTDIDVSLVKLTTQTKHLGEDEVIIEDIPYEDRPHRTLVTTNPTNNEPLLLEKVQRKKNKRM